MKIEVVSKDNFSIFINNCYIDLVNYEDRDKLVEVVKKIIKRLKNRLNLRGFYKLKVFVNKNIGLFVDVIKIDDLDYSNVLDLRVIVFLEDKIYFETDDYFLIEKAKRIRFYNDKFYCLADDIDNIYDFIEFGRFIYGNEAIKMLNNSILV